VSFLPCYKADIKETSLSSQTVSVMKERPLKIDRAPAKQLINLIRGQADVDAFKEFYRLRRDWQGYPLVHDGIGTYGIFSDLTEDLDPKLQASLLPHAVELAKAEVDQRFLCAVFLVYDLIHGFNMADHQDSIRTTIAAMLPRAKKLSIFPNMSCFWNQIVNSVFHWATKDAFFVHDNDWREYTPLDFPPVDDCGWRNCPGGIDKVNDEIHGIGGGEFVLEFKRSALFDGAKYWIWLYRNVSENPVWHWYVYIVTTPDGKTELHRHSMHSVINMSPEELVVKHSYGLVD
jgi:hypothetical protein